MDENSIDDLNIYFYSTKTNYHFYLTQNEPSFEFQILPGSYTIFIAANVHKDMGDMTKAELSQYRYYAESMETDMPMTATMNVRIMSAMTLPTLEVTRAAAKISYSVTVDDGVASTIKLRSIQFCNVPKMTVLFGNGASSTNKVYYGNDAVIDIDDDKVYSGTYYMLDNCQGDVDTITDQKDKSPENAPECATYMRILADGEGKVLEYIVFLGENSTSNFDIRKNTHHTMDLVIRGESQIDKRVHVYDGLYYGVANSYICTGTKLSFDVTPYRTSEESRYIYSNVYAGESYEAAKAELLWETIVGLVKNVTLQNNEVTVTTSGAKGNAVVALYNSAGKIIWSFHIWATEQPSLLNLKTSSKNPNNQYQMMDRDLGAYAPDSCGLVYQWGRKDPMPSLFVGLRADKTYLIKIYGKDGTSLMREMEWSGRANDEYGYAGTIGYTISHPLIFIYQDYYGRSRPWVYGAGSEFYQLWGNAALTVTDYPDNANIVKTIYDPCPQGYKVCPNDAFVDFTAGGAYYDVAGVQHEFIMGKTAGATSLGTIAHSDHTIGFWGSGRAHAYKDYSQPSDSRAVRCVKE